MNPVAAIAGFQIDENIANKAGDGGIEVVAEKIDEAGRDQISRTIDDRCGGIAQIIAEPERSRRADRGPRLGNESSVVVCCRWRFGQFVTVGAIATKPSDGGFEIREPVGRQLRIGIFHGCREKRVDGGSAVNLGHRCPEVGACHWSGRQAAA